MKYTSPIRWALAPLLAAMVLAGCATPAAIDTASLPVTPLAFREGSTAVTTTTPALQGPWWGVFADPVLSQLVEQASRSNNTVQIVAARLAQARAMAGATDANRALQLGLGGGATRQKDLSTGRVPQTVVSAGANLSYELDLFGKLSGASSAAGLDAQSREALLRST